MRLTVTIAILLSVNCNSCETDTGRFEEDISASVPDDFSPRPSLTPHWSRWTTYLPEPDLAEPCGGAWQHCCDRTCAADLVCAFANGACDTGICLGVQGAIQAGGYCVRDGACAPCRCSSVTELCRSSSECCAGLGECGYFDQNDADQDIRRCLPATTQEDLSSPPKVDLAPVCHGTGEACPPFPLPPPAPKFCCSPLICAQSSDSSWRCAP